MKPNIISKLSSAALLALLFGAAGFASAATSTKSINFTGTVTTSTPAATCGIVSAPTVDASYVIPVGGLPQYTKSTTVTVNCTTGVNFLLLSPTPSTSLSRGADPSGATVTLEITPGTNIGTTPYASVGTGANQVLPMNVIISGRNGANINSGDVGAISGAVPLNLLY
jgi:hypothetical protein